jgi:hypothetical protein
MFKLAYHNISWATELQTLEVTCTSEASDLEERRPQHCRRGEIAVRIEKIIATVLDEAHKRQVEEVMDTLEEGPEGLYKRPPY